MKNQAKLEQMHNEIEAAVSGFNQEMKEIISKYQKVTDVGGTMIQICSDGTDTPKGNIFLVPKEDIKKATSHLEVLSEPTLDAEIENELNGIGLEEEAGEVEFVPVKLLDSDVTSGLAYRNANSKSVLFAPHHIKQ